MIIDDPRYGGVLNSSGWPPTKQINTVTKSEFLQCLIFNEVVQKRQSAVQAFCRGLDLLNICQLVKEHPDLMKAVFLSDNQADFMPDTFINLICTQKPRDEIKAKVYEWFIEYLQSESRQATLEQILQFCTGLKRIPPMGMKDRITIKFLCASPLPMAEACFSIMRLPTVHTEKAQFFDKMDQGVLLSINYFGQI